MSAAAEHMLPAQREQRYPHLTRAPIIEAVVDWRVKLSANFDDKRLIEVGPLIAPKYELSHEGRGFKYILKQPSGGEPQSTTEDLGVEAYRFRSQDGREIATFKRDGFSFSRLTPYPTWKAVYREAERLWRIYQTVMQPEEISRLAVRYINRILLPLPLSNMGKYLRKPPDLPDGVPELVSSLFFRVVVHDPPSGVATNINQVVEGHSEDGKLPYILDIDSYLVQSLDAHAVEFNSRFALLHEMKNRIFFATLTEETISMFR